MSQSFKQFLATALPGTRYAYHVGLLMKDRQEYEPWSSKWGKGPLHYAANAVWEAYEEGKVELVQEKREGIYIYYAIKRRYAPNRRRDYQPDDKRRELFGSFSGPRSPFQSAVGRGVALANTDRAG